MLLYYVQQLVKMNKVCRLCRSKMVIWVKFWKNLKNLSKTLLTRKSPCIQIMEIRWGLPMILPMSPAHLSPLDVLGNCGKIPRIKQKLTHMERYNREKVREFFKEFWSNSDNVRRFNEGSSDRARSADCRLVRGNVALMSNFITTDSDHENLCRELGFPVLKFVVK